MLPFYAKQFSTVEINHSFYRMPSETALLNWANSVPEGFRFALKANQQITHIQRLRDCETTLKRFLEVASVLNDGHHLGPILVQLPPTFKFDRPLLEDFLALRPPAFRFAFEVRHPSWYTDETYAVLREHQTALCLSETEKQTPPDVLTANFTYARLRGVEKAFRRLAGPGARRLRLLQTRRFRQSPRLRAPTTRTNPVTAKLVYLGEGHGTNPVIVPCSLSSFALFLLSALVLHSCHAKQLFTENRAIGILLRRFAEGQ